MVENNRYENEGVIIEIKTRTLWQKEICVRGRFAGETGVKFTAWGRDWVLGIQQANNNWAEVPMMVWREILQEGPGA